jgi:hypothetical protein
MEMSFCICPTVDETVDSVSIFTWLGEIFYYKGSLLPAILAVKILADMARASDRRFVRGKMHPTQLSARPLKIALSRSRTRVLCTLLLELFSFPHLFLHFFLDFLCNLTRDLRRLSPVPAYRVLASPGTGKGQS